jgi:hypothetical protein
MLLLVAGVAVLRLSRTQETERVDVNDKVFVQQDLKLSRPVDPPPADPVAVERPHEIAVRTKLPSPRVRRFRNMTIAVRAKDGTHLTSEELYAYQKLKVALFLAGSQMKIVKDTIDQVDSDQQNGKLNR